MKNNFYLVKVFVNPTPPEIKRIGFLPVAIEIPEVNKTAICIWAYEDNAKIYSNYEKANMQLPDYMSANFIIESVTLDEIVQISKLSGHEYITTEPENYQGQIGYSDYYRYDDFKWRFEKSYN